MSLGTWWSLCVHTREGIIMSMCTCTCWHDCAHVLKMHMCKIEVNCICEMWVWLPYAYITCWHNRACEYVYIVACWRSCVHTCVGMIAPMYTCKSRHSCTCEYIYTVACGRSCVHTCVDMIAHLSWHNCYHVYVCTCWNDHTFMHIHIWACSSSYTGTTLGAFTLMSTSMSGYDSVICPIPTWLHSCVHARACIDDRACVYMHMWAQSNFALCGWETLFWLLCHTQRNKTNTSQNVCSH